MRADLGHLAVVDDGYGVGVPNSREAVGDDDTRPTLPSPV